MKNFGFTLAEVLITLGVIGVVSAITMPALIQNYQKQSTVSRLKHAYSMLEQAVKLSEIDNGELSEWTYPAEDADVKDFVKKYISPYLKNTSLEEYDNGTILKLSNGTMIKISRQGTNKQVHATVYFTNPDKSVMGKTAFMFFIGAEENLSENFALRDKKGVRPYDYTHGNYNEDLRKRFIEAEMFGCNAEGNKKLCTALIMYDGWKIADDYPW